MPRPKTQQDQIDEWNALEKKLIAELPPLRACPFCGVAAWEITEVRSGWASDKQYQAKCGNCSCTVYGDSRGTWNVKFGIASIVAVINGRPVYKSLLLDAFRSIIRTNRSSFDFGSQAYLRECMVGYLRKHPVHPNIEVTDAMLDKTAEQLWESRRDFE